jgi:hypothetical protein
MEQIITGWTLEEAASRWPTWRAVTASTCVTTRRSRSACGSWNGGSRARWVGRPLERRLFDEEEQGGERPCLAGSVCEECGAVLNEEGSGHRVGCGARQ